MSTISNTVEANSTPSDSDVDRNAVEALDQAEAFLSQFVDPTDLTPRVTISIEALATEKARQAGLDPSNADDLHLAARSIQNVLKERCVAELTRLDRVCLDLSNETGGKGYLSFEHPSIVFCAVRSGDGLLQRHAPGKLPVRALAVYFDPSLVSTMTSVSKKTGQPYSRPSQYDPNGYVAIVECFGSVAQAEAARDELTRAVAAIQRPISDTAYEDDEIRFAGEWTAAMPTALDSL